MGAQSAKTLAAWGKISGTPEKAVAWDQAIPEYNPFFSDFFNYKKRLLLTGAEWRIKNNRLLGLTLKCCAEVIKQFDYTPANWSSSAFTAARIS
ncbi:hypothetical protein [Bacillus sp. M6-12]|uniref:hypothetical protein n=1 Tax=Bacillus sp. M6-12 TaxID=2054166 RepID=UPI0015E0E034